MTIRSYSSEQSVDLRLTPERRAAILELLTPAERSVLTEQAQLQTGARRYLEKRIEGQIKTATRPYVGPPSAKH